MRQDLPLSPAFADAGAMARAGAATGALRAAEAVAMAIARARALDPLRAPIASLDALRIQAGAAVGKSEFRVFDAAAAREEGLIR
jgi:hypothetical protein